MFFPPFFLSFSLFVFLSGESASLTIPISVQSPYEWFISSAILIFPFLQSHFSALCLFCPLWVHSPCVGQSIIIKRTEPCLPMLIAHALLTPGEHGSFFIPLSSFFWLNLPSVIGWWVLWKLLFPLCLPLSIPHTHTHTQTHTHRNNNNTHKHTHTHW